MKLFVSSSKIDNKIRRKKIYLRNGRNWRRDTWRRVPAVRARTKRNYNDDYSVSLLIRPVKDSLSPGSFPRNRNIKHSGVSHFVFVSIVRFLHAHVCVQIALYAQQENISTFRSRFYFLYLAIMRDVRGDAGSFFEFSSKTKEIGAGENIQRDRGKKVLTISRNSSSVWGGVFVLFVL